MADNSVPMHYDEAANIAKVKAGFKGGNYFSGPVSIPQHTIVDGLLPEVLQKLQAAPLDNPTPQETWFSRRNG